MRLEDARKVVERAPKTELGLAARLVLWELQRREEQERAHPNPLREISDLREQLSAEEERAAIAWEKGGELQAALDKEKDAHNRTRFFLAKSLAARDAAEHELRESHSACNAEMTRLRALEKAVLEVRDGKTVNDGPRRVQERIMRHLAPHLG